MTPPAATANALLAAASLAAAQPSPTSAISAALGLLARFPGAENMWRAAEDCNGLSVALTVGQRASTPGGVARSLRSAAGGTR